MSKKQPEIPKENRQVCLLTPSEASGEREVRCHQHRHIYRLKADEQHRNGELTYLDHGHNQAVSNTPPPTSDASPCHITAREMALNGLSAIEPNHPAVRAAVRKIKAWPQVFDTKAVMVRVCQ